MPVTYTPFTPPASTPDTVPPVAFTPPASTASSTPPDEFTPAESTVSTTAPDTFTPPESTPDTVAPVAFTPPASTDSTTPPTAFTPPGSTPSTTAPVAFFPANCQLGSIAELQAQRTEAYAAGSGSSVEVVFGGVAYLYVLTAGAHAADSTHVLPYDYDATTNAKTWVLTATH